MIMVGDLLPAPIDGKSVTTDWIEEIFDHQTAAWGKGCMVGFINESPVMATWARNVLTWQFLNVASIKSSKELEVLKKRLSVFDDSNAELLHDYEIVGNILIERFFWNSD